VHPTLTAYYFARDSGAAAVRPFPQGLKIATPYGLGVVWFCRHKGGERAASIPPTCPSGNHLVMEVIFPDCWDGQNLDSVDHRSHMAYGRSIGGCPASHPVQVPQLKLALDYPVDGIKKAVFSSGGPETAHADFFNTWDQAALQRLVQACINVNGHCGTGGP